MKLPLKDIYETKNCKPEQLLTVKRLLTEKDCEEYERYGWDSFREEDLIEVFLPELGDPIYFRNNLLYTTGIVVEIKGLRYNVQFESSDLYQDYEATGKSIVLTLTSEPLTKPNVVGKESWRGGYDFKFFGQPTWVQNPHYPVDLNGNPCCHLLTIENGWGDSGNFNILLGFDGDVPNVAFFEASCC